MESGLPDGGEGVPVKKLDRDKVPESGEVERHRLGPVGEVVEYQDHILAHLPKIGENATVTRIEDGHLATTEKSGRLPDCEHLTKSVQGARRVTGLILHIDHLIAVNGVLDDRGIQIGGVRPGKSSIPVRGPLHGGPDSIAISQMDIVSHPDFVSVIENGGSGKGQKKAVHEIDLAPVILHEGSEPASDPDIEAHPWILGIGGPEIVALLVADHLQGQLVVVAKENGPLATLRNRRRLLEDVNDGLPISPSNGDEEAGHQREMIGHVKLVPLAEIGEDVLRPLIGFRQEHPAGKLPVHLGPHPLHEGVSLGKVLTIGSFALKKIGHGIAPETVDPQGKPELDHLQQLFLDLGIVEIQIRLVMKEAVPVILSCPGFPGPVRLFRVAEDDPGLPVPVGGIAPDVIVAKGRGAGRGGGDEPRVRIGRVIEDQLGDHPDPPVMGRRKKSLKILHRPVGRVQGIVIPDIVAVVAKRGVGKREKPQGRHPQRLEIVETPQKSRKISDPVPI